MGVCALCAPAPVCAPLRTPCTLYFLLLALRELRLARLARVNLKLNPRLALLFHVYKTNASRPAASTANVQPTLFFVCIQCRLTKARPRLTLSRIRAA